MAFSCSNNARLNGQDNVQQVAIRPLDLTISLRDWWAIALGAVAGAAFGIATLVLLNPGATAIVAVEIAKLPITMRQTDLTLKPQLVEGRVETLVRLQSQAFADAIAQELGQPQLAQLLPARGNGGQGGLVVRPLASFDTDQIEFRVNAPSEDAALELSDAVIRVLAAQHRELTEQALLKIAPKRDALARRWSDAMQARDTIVAQIVADQGLTAVERATLLAAKFVADEAVSDAYLAYLDIALLNPPARQRTRKIVPVSIVRPLATTYLKSGFFGALAGIGLVILTLAFVRRRLD